MGKISTIKSDTDWQAEADARALISATEIKTDSKRCALAMKAAAKMAADAERTVKNASKVASMKMHSDAKQDAKQIKEMVKPNALKSKMPELKAGKKPVAAMYKTSAKKK